MQWKVTDFSGVKTLRLKIYKQTLHLKTHRTAQGRSGFWLENEKHSFLKC